MAALSLDNCIHWLMQLLFSIRGVEFIDPGDDDEPRLDQL